MNTMRSSNFGIFIVLSFILISFFTRFFFPFADEPDWTVRAPNVIFSDHPFWSPYFIFHNWLSGFNIDHTQCEVQASPMGLSAFIPSHCTENLYQGLIRWVLELFILIPMFSIIIFRRAFISSISVLGVRLSFNEWNNRIDALALSLLFPGMVYYLGVLATEQLSLSVSLYIFLFWGFWVLLSGLVILLISIDFGNSVVVIFFILTLWFLTYVRELGRGFYLFAITIGIGFAYFVGFEFLELFLNMNILTGDLEQKSESIASALNGSELLTKYPIILRPIITFMSFVFLTPSGVKVPLLYLLFIMFIFLITLKVIQKKDKKFDYFWFSPFCIIVFFAFLLPTYSNAKYYIFILPFLIYVSIFFYHKRSVFLLFMGANAFVLLHLLLYRL